MRRRQPRGQPPTAKLTWEQVCRIRDLHAAGHSQSALARQYGVTFGTIHRIVHNQTWTCKPLPMPDRAQIDATVREMYAVGATSRQIAGKLRLTLNYVVRVLGLEPANGHPGSNTPVLAPGQRDELLALWAAHTHSQADLARQYGISRGRVGQIVAKYYHKRCTGCSESKLASIEFSRDRHSPDGRARYCRECRRQQFDAWYALHSQEHIAKVSERRRKRSAPPGTTPREEQERMTDQTKPRKKRLTQVHLSASMRDALEEYKARTGINVSDQIRMALERWCQQHGLIVLPENGKE